MYVCKLSVCLIFIVAKYVWGVQSLSHCASRVTKGNLAQACNFYHVSDEMDHQPEPGHVSEHTEFLLDYKKESKRLLSKQDIRSKTS